MNNTPNADSRGRFNNATSAVFTGVLELFKKKETVRDLIDEDRLDGKIVLVTGGNSGLGLGIATQFAKRGAQIIIGCRNEYPEAVEQIKSLSLNDNVSLRKIDLTSFESIDKFVKGLKKDGIRLDISIHNAGVTPPKGRKTANGLDEMFMVNYLSKFYLANSLLNEGVIPNNTYAENRKENANTHIIFISSDSHQGASDIIIDQLGIFEPYVSANRGVSLYSYNKLILNTYSIELSKRLRDEDQIDVQVNAICPGPVNSNIIRDAPFILRGFLKFIFLLFFKNPQKAALPVVYMAAADEMSQKTGEYFHMNRPKKMDTKCYDETVGKQLWKKSLEIISDKT